MLSCATSRVTNTNTAFSTGTRMHNPLFSETEFMERLMRMYKIRYVVDLVNTNTFIKDSALSYVIVTQRYYILLIRDKKTRLVIRDKCNVYMDSIIKDDWKINIIQMQGDIHFRILCKTGFTFLFSISSNILHFNRKLLQYNDDTVIRMVAVLS